MYMTQLPIAIYIASQDQGGELMLGLEGSRESRDQLMSNEIHVSGFQIYLKQLLTLLFCLAPYYVLRRHLRKSGPK